jgi:hypothetical protein
MKKLFLSALAACALSFSNAQEEKSSTSINVTFGAKAGLNLVTLTGDIEDTKTKAGIHFGAMAEISINDKFSVQPELLFSTQGANVEYSEVFATVGGIVSAVGNYEEKENLSYINLPIIAKYYVTEGLSLEAGPQIGFLVNAEIEEEYNETIEYSNGDIDTFSDSDSVDVKDFRKTVDFGLNFGLGYKLDSGLNFSARYNLGLSNIVDSDFDIEAKNSVFQFSVGYFFN